MRVCQIRQSARDDSLKHLPQCVKERDGPIRLGLSVVILVRLTKNDRDALPEMCGTISLLKTGGKEFMKTREDNIQRLVKDTIEDVVCL